MQQTTQNCKLLIAYDFVDNNFFFDTGSSYSFISASKQKCKTSPNPIVLYSATSNIIQTNGKQALKIDFNLTVDYTWYFIKTDLNFSIIELGVLNFYKLTVDKN